MGEDPIAQNRFLSLNKAMRAAGLVSNNKSPGSPPRAVQPGAQHSLFCLATSWLHAHQIIHRLKQAGVSHNAISALFPNPASEPGLAAHPTSGQPPAESHGPSAAWSAARWIGFGCVGTLDIPGVGLCVAAGPIIFILTSPNLKAPERGLACGLTGVGISEWEAARYEVKIKQGNILISVRTTNPAEMIPSRAIFQAAGALDIWSTGEDPAEWSRA